LDYFWLLAGIWAGFGTLLAGLVLRRLDISRMSYREARQLLSAMVCSLSTRIRQNEMLTRELSEQVQMLNANQARISSSAQTADKERLLEYMQDWTGNVKQFVEKVDRLEKNLKNVEQQFQDMRIHVDRLTRSQDMTSGNRVVPVGVVTEDTLGRLSQTERSVLELLVSGRRAAPEIGRLMTKSREHTARLMKALFEQGFVERETDRQPYEYHLNDKVKDVLARSMEQEATPSSD
jgi:uncharacterized protein YukE